MVELQLALSPQEFHVLNEVLQDAIDDDKWTEAWKQRVRPVRERFRDITHKLNERDAVDSALECSGAKVVQL